MHPRIKARYLDNLQARQTRAIIELHKGITTLETKMEFLIKKLSDCNNLEHFYVSQEMISVYKKILESVKSGELRKSCNANEATKLRESMKNANKILIAQLGLHYCSSQLNFLRESLSRLADLEPEKHPGASGSKSG